MFSLGKIIGVKICIFPFLRLDALHLCLFGKLRVFHCTLLVVLVLCWTTLRSEGWINLKIHERAFLMLHVSQEAKLAYTQ